MGGHLCFKNSLLQGASVPLSVYKEQCSFMVGPSIYCLNVNLATLVILVKLKTINQMQTLVFIVCSGIITSIQDTKLPIRKGCFNFHFIQ